MEEKNLLLEAERRIAELERQNAALAAEVERLSAVQGEPEVTINAVISLVKDAAAAHLNSEFGPCLSKIRKLLTAAPPPAEQAKPTRQYYYRMDSCKSLSPGSDQCICWHDEGEGPLADGSAKHWRIKPTEQQPTPVVTQLVEALERIVAWPDGGNQYGQANIKIFAAEALVAYRNQGGEA